MSVNPRFSPFFHKQAQNNAYPFTAPMVRPDTKYFWKKG